MQNLILAADIGGTKTLLALANEAGTILLERRFASNDYPDFDAVLDAFLGEARASGHTGPIRSAAFGVAGPVEGNRAQLTYLPWFLDGAALAERHGLGRVRLANDFEAVASAIPGLGPEQFSTLQAGQPLAGAPIVVLGAGTGLGVASLVWHGESYKVIPGEGGHMGFAPADEEQAGLWRHLWADLGRVTAETAISGPGLSRIHRYLGGGSLLADPAHVFALSQTEDELARRSVDLFLRCYGAFAGDLALMLMARGGVYLAGGIAPKLLPRFVVAGFLEAFGAKGCHAHIAATMPVHVVTEERLGLLGALSMAKTPGA